MNFHYLSFTRILTFAILLSTGFAGFTGIANADPQAQIIAGYAAQAKQIDQGFKEFSAKRGEDFFLSSPATGKPDLPSCTACHTKNPMNAGRTRAGKEIAPMAVSRTPDRFMDIKKVEKWFRRNCKSVLGRTCTSLEKGDFLTFMVNQ